jgi:hypothetical protein
VSPLCILSTVDGCVFARSGSPLSAERALSMVSTNTTLFGRAVLLKQFALEEFFEPRRTTLVWLVNVVTALAAGAAFAGVCCAQTTRRPPFPHGNMQTVCVFLTKRAARPGHCARLRL